MQEDYSDHDDHDDGPLLTSNAEQALCCGKWRHLLVVSSSLPLRAHPLDGCSAHALCVSLVDELKEEVHVVVRHKVRHWRRVAKPGTWCAVAGLLPAPFQHNARVWRTNADSRIRSSVAHRLRIHLYPRAWQEQHSRTRAGLFLVVRRLRSGDLLLRAQSDGEEFLLVTYFSSRVASLPLVPVGTLVSLHGASCLDRQGVLAMCARTDLRVVSPVDGNEVTQTSAQAGEGADDKQQTNRSRDGSDESCCIEQREERSFESEPLRTRMQIVNSDYQETLGEISYLDAVSNLFNCSRANKSFSSVSDKTETASPNNWQCSVDESLSLERPQNTQRLFESPQLYKPPRKYRRMPRRNAIERKVPVRGHFDKSKGFPTLELEDEDPGSCGACALDVGARNLAQYLWYLEMVVKFRGRFGEALESDSLELSVAKLLCYLNPMKDDQGFEDTPDACPSSSCHCLPDYVLADCFSDDHACPLVAGGETAFPVELCLEAVFHDTLQVLLEGGAGLNHYEPASISKRLQNVVGILELSPRGCWLLRQPRFHDAAFRKQKPLSAWIESKATTAQFDSGFQSPEDSPVFIDSDFQSQKNSQIIIDTDSQSQRQTSSRAESYFPSFCSFELKARDGSERSSDCFVAVVMNAKLDAAMHGRLVLLSECRLVVERRTPHEIPAGLWLDSPAVQELARLPLPAPQTALPPTTSFTGPCPLCVNDLANTEHCDERWDPDIDFLGLDSESWDLEPVGEVDPGFIASSVAKRHRFVLHAIATPATDDNGQRSCLLLISLLQSFSQRSCGRAAMFSLRGLQLRWLPLLGQGAGFTLRGCVTREPDVLGLPVFRTRSTHATLERHVCSHDWPEIAQQGMRSLVALVVGSNARPCADGLGPARCFAESAWLDLCDDADGSVSRLYLRGWGHRDLPRALICGARLRVTFVHERTSAAGRKYLHPTLLTNIQVVSLVSADPAWWAVALPSIGLPGVMVGMLPPQCVRWALAAARCPRCSAVKRQYVCERCGLAGPSRSRVTIRLRAESDVVLIAVDDVAASVLGYTALAWQQLIAQVSRVGGSLEWAGPDDEVPEDRDSEPWVRRFYAACRSQPSVPLAVRCRAFKAQQDSADSRFVLEARHAS